VATSISSGGDGAATADWGLNSLRLQPYLRFFDQRRGWIEVTCATSQMHADFHVLDYVSRPGAAARRAASFVVEDGSARLQPA
jgi:alkaline phosphatase D